MIDDQTKFSFEEPLLENRDAAQPDPEKLERERVEAAARAELPPLHRLLKHKHFKLMIVAGSVILILLGYSLVAFLSSAPQQNEESIPSPSPQIEIKNRTELEQAFETTQKALQEADPARNDLAFPPVSMDLILE